MSQPGDVSTSISKIRTFASDLDAARTKRDKAETKPENTQVAPIKKPATELKLPTSQVVKPKKIVTVIKKRQNPETIMSEAPALKPIPASLHEGITSFSKTKSIEVDTEDGASATIITDTKRNRFKLIPAVIESLKKWFEDKKRSLTVKKTPKYSVPESSLRKGVIQKATSKTGRFATADFDSIQERIKKRNAIIEDDAKTVWTPNTETGFYLLEAPEKTVVNNVQIISKKSFSTPETKPVEPATPTPTTVEEESVETVSDTDNTVTEVVTSSQPETTWGEEPTEEESTQVTETTPTEDVAEVIIEEPAEETDEVIQADIQVSATEVEPTAEFNVPIKIVDSKNSAAWFSRKEFWLSTNILTLSIATVTVFFIAIGTITLINQSTTSSTISSSLTPIIDRVSAAELKLSNLQLDSVVSAFIEAEVTINKTTELIPTVDGGEVSAGNTIAVIYPQADRSFTHTIKRAHFGYSDQKVPFIVLEFTDERAVFGSMLVWEHSMTKDLADVLGNDPDIKDAFFDENISGFDIRYTLDNNQDVIVYGIINNKVVITTDRLTMKSLIDLIK
jgi:hypothetical protein